MPKPVESIEEILQRSYDAAGVDIEFASILAHVEYDSEDRLADLIEADGRLRLARSLPVTLDRYLGAIADLRDRRVALDAAIEFSLRSLSVRTGSSERAAAQMAQAFPDLADPIMDAVSLGDALMSTEGLHASLTTQRCELELPCDLGPPLADGRGRYDIRHLVGHGAQGAVYAGVDRKLSDPEHPAWVAIKLLDPSAASQLDRHVLDEARRARRIAHENVARVFDVDATDDTRPFIVQELVDGGDLAAWVKARHGKLAPRDAVGLMIAIARGVQAAHAAQIVHCDLKPSNILMTRDGKPKVADFGIAAPEGDIAVQMQPIGNIAYISPEQFRAEPDALTATTDIYALGGILYSMLTGVLPNGSSRSEIAARHVRDRGAPPSAQEINGSIDADLDAICARALAPDISDRYASADGFASDLERWLRREPLYWNAPSPARVAALAVRRRPVVAALSAVLVLGLMTAAGFIARQRASHTNETLRLNTVAAEREAHDAKKLLDQTRVMAHDMFITLRRSRTNQLSADWLPGLTAMEAVMGRSLMLPREGQPDIWNDRIGWVTDLIQFAHEEGRDSDFDILMWKTAQSFWLLRQGNYTLGQAMLAEARQRWSSMLSDDDRWLVYLDMMREAAIVYELEIAGAKQGMLPDQMRVRLEAAEALVTQEQQVFTGHRLADPVHWYVLGALRRLYDTNLLNDPEALLEWRKRAEIVAAS